MASMAAFGAAEGPVRAITLDLDDTLWPVQPVLTAASQRMVEWLRPRAPRSAAVFAAGYDLQALKRQYPEHSHDMSWLRTQKLRDVLSAQQEDPALAEAAFEVFFEARQCVHPWDDAIEILEIWSRRYRIAAISNGNADVFRSSLGRYFHAAYGASTFGSAKPDPRIFHAACAGLGVPPGQVLHIGDDLELDVLAARRAGLQSAWLRRPGLYNPSDVSLLGEDALPRQFNSLYEIHLALGNSDLHC